MGETNGCGQKLAKPWGLVLSIAPFRREPVVGPLGLY